MEQSKRALRRARRKKRNLVLSIILLAVVCVAGVELFVCRWADPILYNEIMTPVRACARMCAETAQEAGRAALRQAELAEEAARRQLDRACVALQAQWEVFTAPPADDAEATTLAQPESLPPEELLDPEVTGIAIRDGVEYLTGGGADVAYFNQTDMAWEEAKYGSDPLSTHGCGPTVMSMAVSTLGAAVVNPVDMAQFCVSQGYWAKGHGSYHAIVPGVARAYGLQCTSIDPAGIDRDALFARLEAGDLAVVLVTKGHFTEGGHFILLRGVTPEGQVLVADPASRDRSLSPWDLDLIVSELSRTRSDGSPFWLLSREEAR